MATHSDVARADSGGRGPRTALSGGSTSLTKNYFWKELKF